MLLWLQSLEEPFLDAIKENVVWKNLIASTKHALPTVDYGLLHIPIFLSEKCVADTKQEVLAFWLKLEVSSYIFSN